MRDLFDAFNRNDADVIKRLMAPDGEIVPLRSALEGISFAGPGAVDRFLAAVEESWSRTSIEVEEIHDGPNGVFARVRFRATGRESGIDLKAEHGWFVRFEQEKVARVAPYRDVDEARRLAGVE